MKNRFLAFAFIVSLTWLLSCSKTSPAPTPIIFGTLKVFTEEEYNCTTATDNKVYTCGAYAYCTTITFKSDKTFQVVHSSDNSSLGTGTYVFTNGYVSLSYTGNITPSVYAATITGTKLITTYTSSSSSCSSRYTYQKQ